MKITCRHAIEDIFRDEDGILTEKQIVNRIYKKYSPSRWTKGTIRNFLVALSVNRSSRKNHPSYWKYNDLYFVKGKGYRKYNTSQDGLWETTEKGTRPVNVSQ